MKDLQYIVNDIKAEVERPLQRSGIYYRIFARQKSDASIKKKMSDKAAVYRADGKKMQDLIGLRVIVYFREDVELIHKFFKHHFPGYLETSDTNEDIARAESQQSELGVLRDKVFMPTRLNLVLRMDERCSKNLKDGFFAEDINTSLIDNTYELQLRSVLSEGWHEVEHDLRYKTRNDTWWSDCETESRMLNGIYATLETSERAMEQVFSNIAYKNYKSKEWSAMIRNHFKLRITGEISNYLERMFNDYQSLGKTIFRFQRDTLISTLLSLNIVYPLTVDNVIFMVNRLSRSIDQRVKDEIIGLEPTPIRTTLDKIFGENPNSKF